MANSPLLALACLALLAASAAGCNIVSETQTGTLKEQVPNGCLSTKKVQAALMDVVKPACFDAVKLNFTNSTGADCEMPGTYFNVSFSDPECFSGEAVGSGKMTPTADGGNTIAGQFVSGQNFSGSSTPGGLFTVSVDGMDCKLAYNNIKDQPIVTSPMPPASPGMPSPPPTPTKSSAVIGVVPAVLLSLLAGALALAI